MPTHSRSWMTCLRSVLGLTAIAANSCYRSGAMGEKRTRSASPSPACRASKALMVLYLSSWGLIFSACSGPRDLPATGAPAQIYSLRAGTLRAISLSPNAELLLIRTASTNSGIGFSLIRTTTGEVMQVQVAQTAQTIELQSLTPSDRPMRWAADSSRAYVPFAAATSGSHSELDVTSAGVSTERGSKDISWLEIGVEPQPRVSRLLVAPPAALATNEARDYLDPKISIRPVGLFGIELADAKLATPFARLAYFGVRKLSARHISGPSRRDVVGIIVGGERLFAWGPRARVVWLDGRHEPLELSGDVFPPLVWHPLLPDVFAIARNRAGTLEIRRWKYERAPP